MIKIDFTCGTVLERAIRSARAVATEVNERVEFTFNEVLVRVDLSTEVHALLMDYWRACIFSPRFTSIGPTAKSSPEYKVVVVVYGEIEECKSFINEFQRSSWIDGASYGADKYGGSINLYHEKNLPGDKALRDKVWRKLLNLAESEEST